MWLKTMLRHKIIGDKDISIGFVKINNKRKELSRQSACHTSVRALVWVSRAHVRLTELLHWNGRQGQAQAHSSLRYTAVNERPRFKQGAPIVDMSSGFKTVLWYQCSSNTHTNTHTVKVVTISVCIGGNH